MKFTSRKTRHTSRIASIIVFVLFFIISLFSSNFSIAQENQTIVDSTASESKGPSVENIAKNLESANEELDRIHRQEIMEYVYMVLGFAAVFAFAWYLANKAKKRKEKEDEAKILRLQNMKHRPHNRR